MAIGVLPICVLVMVAIIFVVVPIGMLGVVAAIIMLASMLTRVFSVILPALALCLFVTLVLAALVHGTVVTAMVVVCLVSFAIWAIDPVVVLASTIPIGIVLAFAAGGLGIIGHPQGCDTQGQDRG